MLRTSRSSSRPRAGRTSASRSSTLSRSCGRSCVIVGTWRNVQRPARYRYAAGLSGRIATTSTGVDDRSTPARVDLAAEPPRLARLHRSAPHGPLRPVPVRDCCPSAGCGGLGGRNAEGRPAQDTIDSYPAIGRADLALAATLPASWQNRQRSAATLLAHP